MSQKHRKKSPTSKDVARLAGVSQATVSRAFSNKENTSVKEEVRDKIYKVANEIGYKPNLLARSMISGKSDMVALVIGEGIGIFYQTIILELIEKIQQTGKQCLVFKLNKRQSIAEIIATVVQFQVESIIITAPAISKEIENICEKLSIPVVIFNRFCKGLSSIYTNPFKGGELAAEHLVSHGHKNLAYIHYKHETQEENEKRMGFLSKLRSYDIHNFHEYKASYSYESGYEVMNELMRDTHSVTAVFCSSDMIAIGAADCVKHEFHMVTGEDISIIGYDDIRVSNWKSYNLDTIKQPVDSLVQETVDLINKLSDGTVEIFNKVVDLQLIVRGSVKNLKK